MEGKYNPFKTFSIDNGERNTYNKYKFIKSMIEKSKGNTELERVGSGGSLISSVFLNGFMRCKVK